MFDYIINILFNQNIFFFSFFFSLNSFINIGNRLFRVLDRVSKSNDNQQMTKEDYHSIDFHQQYDRLFLDEYIRIHHIPHVTVSNPSSKLFSCSSCCPCLHSDWFLILVWKKKDFFLISVWFFFSFFYDNNRVDERWLTDVRIKFFFDQIMKIFRWKYFLCL